MIQTIQFMEAHEQKIDNLILTSNQTGSDVLKLFMVVIYERSKLAELFVFGWPF